MVYIDNSGSAGIGTGGVGLADRLYVGNSGTGVLNLSGGGKAIAKSYIYLGDKAGWSWPSFF